MKRLVLAILFLVAAAWPVAAAEVIDRIVALVNDDLITSYDLNRETERIAAESRRGGRPEGEATPPVSAVVNSLIDRQLVEQKVKELNIRVTDEEVQLAINDVKSSNNLTDESLQNALKAQGLTLEQYRMKIREQLERVRLMSQEVRAKVQVGEKDVRDYYDAHPAAYSREDLFHVRQIFFRISPKASPEEVKQVMALAVKVRDEAREGKDFTELAKRYSDDPQAKEDGGDLGTLKKGEMLPEFESAVVNMKSGEVSDLVSATAGIHIIKVETRTPGTLKPFAEVKDEIENTLYQKRSEERFNLWLADLRKSAAIELRM